MTQAKKLGDPLVVWREWQGTRAEVIDLIAKTDFPAAWGPREVVCAYIVFHLPSMDSWAGTARATGYQTPPNDLGNHTAYISLHWQTRKGA